ncbi:MAG: DUF6069 family protein [Acidimicrobiia bacterium]
MTATSTFTGPSPSTAKTGTPRKLWKTGAVAGVSASVATTAFAALALAVDVPLTVGGKSIPVAGFAQLTLIASIIGTILAMVLARRARQPQRTFVVTTVGLTALSIIPDVLADASTSTRITLAISHVLAAVIVIPALASRLSG